MRLTNSEIYEQAIEYAYGKREEQLMKEIKTMKLNEVKIKPKYKIGNIVEYKSEGGSMSYYAKIIKAVASAAWRESKPEIDIEYYINGGGSIKEQNIIRVAAEE